MIWVLLMLVVAGCQSGGSSSNSSSGGQSVPSNENASTTSYLGLLDQNAVYPISNQIDVRKMRFPVVPFTFSKSGEAVNSRESVRFTESIKGGVGAEPAGANILLTIIILDSDAKTNPGGYEKIFAGVLVPPGTVIMLTVDRYGAIKGVHASGPGITPGNAAVIQAEAAIPGSEYGRSVMALPPGGIGQDTVLGPRTSPISGSLKRVDLLTVTGQATFHHRPVIVFKDAGVLQRVDAGNTEQIGDITGFAFLDEATGMMIYESEDVSFRLTESGVETTTRMHNVNELELR